MELTNLLRIFPKIKWAQRKDRIWITIDELLDIEKTTKELTDDGKLTFKSSAHGQKFGFELDLY